jgi:hypothetical protein
VVSYQLSPSGTNNSAFISLPNSGRPFRYLPDCFSLKIFSQPANCGKSPTGLPAPKKRQASFDSEPRPPERLRDPARVASLAKQSEQLLVFLWRPEPPPLPP